MRYAQFTMVQDASVRPEYSVTCVSGDHLECGGESGGEGVPEVVEAWMRQHAQDTGHRRYRRSICDYAECEPPKPPESPKSLEPPSESEGRRAPQ
ncbi:hypothetical protein ACFU99_34745 [Streptomyces sp. NPDC057654]|uniref:DUF7848 domain-containing protein n=1 Tax=Streptomyces sp. NPDC057654 TaxID=3346196 RepID=UPI0036C87662